MQIEYIIAIIFVVIVFEISSQGGMNKMFDYKCENCGEKIRLPFFSITFVPYSKGRRRIKCPKCGEKTWGTPVLKEKR